MIDTFGAKLQRDIAAISESFNRDVVARMEAELASNKNIPSEEYRGLGRQFLLEAHVRAFVLDPLLKALGWRIDSAESLTVEYGVENAQSGEHRRFLDYLGREISHEGVSTALLMVEAKRPRIPLPGGSKRGREVEGDIAKALGDLLAEKKRLGVNGVWKEFLKTQVDYYKRLSESKAGAPRRAMMTNGDWIVVFLDPKQTFGEKKPSERDILVFTSLEECVNRAQELDAAVSFRSLSSHIPTQHFSNVHSFFENRKDQVKGCFTARVSTGRLGQRQPTMAVELIVNLQTPQGNWVSFEQPVPNLNVLRNNGHEALAQLEEVASLGQSLLGKLKKHVPIALVSSKEFVESAHEKSATSQPPSICFVKHNSRDSIYEVHLGEMDSLIASTSSFDGCPYHDFGPCFDEGNAVADAAIPGARTNPPVYFPSGDILHCSHMTVHTKRQTKCHLVQLDQYLCCRRCAFQDSCWNGDFSDLPCKEA